MADINILIPKILRWEGGFVNDPTDKGGATNLGITLKNWKIEGYDKDGDGDIDVDDIKILTIDDFKPFFKRLYWDNYWKADNIKNQSIANILVDWCYNSGSHGVRIPQQLLGTIVDGKVGAKTLETLNNANQQEFFNKVWNARKQFYLNIVEKSVNEYKAKNPTWKEKDLLKFTQKKFLQGWLNRLNSYTF